MVFLNSSFNRDYSGIQSTFQTRKWEDTYSWEVYNYNYKQEKFFVREPDS